MVPTQAGYHLLPNTLIFGRLLRYASRTPARVVIDDVRSNHLRTRLELLSDVLALRETMLNTFGKSTMESLQRREEVFIVIVAAGGYEYTVAMHAVLALGAPVTPALLIEEATYYVEKSESVLVLVSSSDLKKCCDLEKRIATMSNERFRGVPIGPCTYTTLDPSAILISSNRALEENAPGVMISMSGTTGSPKASVIRRAFVFNCVLSVTDHYRITEDDVLLHVLPVHHVTGAGINVFSFLIFGSHIEPRSSGFEEAWKWKRWKEGAVSPHRWLTFFSGVPTIHILMRRHYQRVLYKLPPEELAKYIAGKGIVQRYGATEFSAVFMVSLDDKKVPTSFDIIKSNGYRIPVLGIERELLSLPYVAEVMTVGVVDEEFGQHVATVISFQKEDLADASLTCTWKR
ncbi:acetyl-CoA synthetase-like protein [Dothidotthia symphoricarpi CBS 119687]|uniref:Acetyl-CoA synthetase-like protein n=1 Tax=Dothidotthia symphoricarpi CBS 119687 TaxID=1392245 RepID=A0A6A6A5P8_9PLEO|nr:acetyl-CoA synthetase-like protein [Dothidotthia symphoricarpi CBS 119687]KAF2127140.1 acetyl-CoA synthetase-like protein [Dothidotthia symphoricarpi CBS 119687]